MIYRGWRARYGNEACPTCTDPGSGMALEIPNDSPSLPGSRWVCSRCICKSEAPEAHPPKSEIKTTPECTLILLGNMCRGMALQIFQKLAEEPQRIFDVRLREGRVPLTDVELLTIAKLLYDGLVNPTSGTCERDEDCRCAKEGS